MNENNCRKNSHRKRDGIILSGQSDKVVIVGSNSVNVEIHNSKIFSEASNKLLRKTDESAIVTSYEDSESKSLLKLSVQMNNWNDNNNCEIFSLDNNSSSNYRNPSHNGDISSHHKIDNASRSKICNSCKHSNSKIINCTSPEGKVHVSIKSDRPLYCCKGHKIELNCDITCTESELRKHMQHAKGTLTTTKEPKKVRLDVLFEFLNHMRQMVVTRELTFSMFRSVTLRLMKDKMNIELLMLIEVIIRAQVVQMSRLISLDLFRQKASPAVFVISFLKQYQFLKSLSFIYKDILNDYEREYLTTHNLSFDLISRTYFKLIISDCPRIKEQIASGYMNIKLEKIFDSSMSKEERAQIKSNYLSLKSDFQDNNNWKDIDKNIRHILIDPDNVVKSLVNYFNNHFTLYFPSSFDCKKECCDNSSLCVTHHSNCSYKDLIRTLPNLPERDSSSLSNHNGHSIEYHRPNSSEHSTCDHQAHHPPQLLSQKQDTHKCHLYQTLENIKPPSVSCSSSSNNSNGYNSCLSISSYEDSSDDGDNIDSKEEKYFQKWKRKKNMTEETKPPSPVSLNDDEDNEATKDGHLSEHKNCIFRDKVLTGGPEEIEQFNKLYQRYLSENEYLLENTGSISAAQMSVPEYLNKLEKADNLQSIIKILKKKFKKDMDTQICPSATVDLSGAGPCHSHTHSHVHQSSLDCVRHTNVRCSKHKDHKAKEKDFEIDFEELLKTFGVDTSTRENLEEFEKFLENKLKTDKGKIRPNLEALVKNCRIYCKKLCSGTAKDGPSKPLEAGCHDPVKIGTQLPVSSSSCGDDRFDTPYDCPSMAKNEACSKHNHCLNGGNNHSHNHSSSNNNNCNTSININISSSETCSSSASTENTGNNKVCNCCKCEMFGEQTSSSSSAKRGTNVKEKLRIKLEKRKQCQQKSQIHQMSSLDIDLLPDVDKLVNFINGADKMKDNQPQTPDTVRALPKKGKLKTNKLKTKKTVKPSSVLVDGPIIVKEESSVESRHLKVNGDKQVSSALINGCVRQNDVPDKVRNQKKDVAEAKEAKKNQSKTMANKAVSSDKEVYDPVVEDFKRFCSNVVVTKQRKKLPIDPTLLIDEVDKRPRSSGGVNETP